MTEFPHEPQATIDSRNWLASVPTDWNGWQAFENEVNESRAARDSLRDWLANRCPADDHARKGLGHFAAGNSAAALPHLEQAGDDLCRLLAGRARLWAGDRAAGHEHLKAVSGSSAVGVRAVLWSLEDACRDGDADEFVGQLEILRGLSAPPAALAYAEGLLSSARGDHEGAVASWRLALQHDGDCSDARFRLAYRLDLEGQDDEARELYEEFTAEDRRPHLGALMNLGILYEDRDDFINAVRVYRLVHDLDPTNKRAGRYLADAEASLEQYYDETRERKVDKQNAVMRIPVTDFELSVRARNCLQRMNIHSLGDLVCRTESELLAFKNFGETSLQEVKDVLTMKGLRLGMLPSPPSGGLPSAGVVTTTPELAPTSEGDVSTMPIAELDLSVRSRAALATLGIRTVEELVKTSEPTLLACKNFGQTSLDEIRSKLRGLGLELGQ